MWTVLDRFIDMKIIANIYYSKLQIQQIRTSQSNGVQICEVCGAAEFTLVEAVVEGLQELHQRATSFLEHRQQVNNHIAEQQPERTMTKTTGTDDKM